MRAIWTGEIALGGVTVPTKLYSETSATRVRRANDNAVKPRKLRSCPKCRAEVDPAVCPPPKRGVYALFTKEELAILEGEDARGKIEIVEFVDPLDVDLAFIDKSYWVGPGGKDSGAFSLLREALAKSGRVALAKVKLRTRTRLAILRPKGKIFALDMVRYADEVVSDEEINGPASPESAVLALEHSRTLAERLATDEETPTPAPGAAKVIDLAERLTRTLKRSSR